MAEAERIVIASREPASPWQTTWEGGPVSLIWIASTVKADKLATAFTHQKAGGFTSARL